MSIQKHFHIETMQTVVTLDIILLQIVERLWLGNVWVHFSDFGGFELRQWEITVKASAEPTRGCLFDDWLTWNAQFKKRKLEFLLWEGSISMHNSLPLSHCIKAKRAGANLCPYVNICSCFCKLAKRVLWIVLDWSDRSWFSSTLAAMPSHIIHFDVQDNVDDGLLRHRMKSGSETNDGFVIRTPNLP